jgi:glycosyltransferase involved in cell wall biosynthesis
VADTRGSNPREPQISLTTWHIITGEYPPQPGGVSDYTRLVAIELARAGDAVNVWAPAPDASESVEERIIVHRLPGHFGPSALRILDRALHATPGRILVQYVPHAFGMKAMNLPFVMWLYARRKMDIAVMFHEVTFPIHRSQSPRQNVLGMVNRAMAAIAARASRRIFVSTTSWGKVLRTLIPVGARVVCIPMPSNIPVVNDREGIAAVRRNYSPAGPLVGHFGTFGPGITSLLDKIVPALLDEVPAAHTILIGRNSEQYATAIARERPDLVPRVHASGSLTPCEVSMHISACDLLLQPYPDGITTRRTSAMVGLAHSVAIVTNSGHLTEPLWSERQAVAIAPANDIASSAALARDLLGDTERREQLAKAGASLYEDQFDIRQTIAALRAA